MLSIWSIYGLAALFKFNIKNAFYNILDIFLKFLWFIFNIFSLFFAF